MTLFGLYYKRADGSFDGPAVGLFETKSMARKYVFDDHSCPRTEFEIIEHKAHLADDKAAPAPDVKVSGSKEPDPDPAAELLDGDPIIKAVREASAQFLIDASKAYKPAIEKMIEKNVGDPRTRKIMDEMAETMVTQMEQRLTKLFDTPDKG